MSLVDHALILTQFESNRDRLCALAMRLLGSRPEAEDALQEAWLRLEAADTTSIENLNAWLTTVVSRISIDVLRSRSRRREVPDDVAMAGQFATMPSPGNPEADVLLAESVGIAMLVVLNRLRPHERVAFVMHDVFALPFQDVAAILDCSPDAARQLASRARRTVRGAKSDAAAGDRAREHELVEAFFTASRAGDIAALIRVLHNDVSLTVDPMLGHGPDPLVMRGAQVVARRARLGAAQQGAAQMVSIDDQPGIIVAPNGRLTLAMKFEIQGEKIIAIKIIAHPDQLDLLELALLPNETTPDLRTIEQQTTSSLAGLRER